MLAASKGKKRVGNSCDNGKYQTCCDPIDTKIVFQNLNETFEKCSILFEYKEGDQILNQVQP